MAMAVNTYLVVKIPMGICVGKEISNVQYITIFNFSCSGNGVCLSLRETASLSYSYQKEPRSIVYDTPWDAEYVEFIPAPFNLISNFNCSMVRGCACFREVSVDNQYSDALRPGGHGWRTQYPERYNVSKFYRQVVYVLTKTYCSCFQCFHIIEAHTLMQPALGLALIVLRRSVPVVLTLNPETPRKVHDCPSIDVLFPMSLR